MAGNRVNIYSTHHEGHLFSQYFRCKDSENVEKDVYLQEF